MVKDLVCGMDIDENLAKEQGKTLKYKGEIYYFCSMDCKEAFSKNPEKFLKNK